jgi:hypothetical protein
MLTLLINLFSRSLRPTCSQRYVVPIRVLLLCVNSCFSCGCNQGTGTPSSLGTSEWERIIVRIISKALRIFRRGAMPCVHAFLRLSRVPTGGGHALQLARVTWVQTHVIFTSFSRVILCSCMHFASTPRPPMMAFARAHAPHNDVLARRTMLRPDTASNLNKASNQGQWTC